jgi:hypothetical protein
VNLPPFCSQKGRNGIGRIRTRKTEIGDGHSFSRGRRQDEGEPYRLALQLFFSQGAFFPPILKELNLSAQRL